MKHTIFSKAFITLTYGESWERFAFYGLQMLIVLISLQRFHATQVQALALYGAVSCFGFALPLIGGFLADRLLGYRICLIMGIVLLIGANILLALPQWHCFLFGLALFIIGTGLYSPFGKICDTLI